MVGLELSTKNERETLPEPVERRDAEAVAETTIKYVHHAKFEDADVVHSILESLPQPISRLEDGPSPQEARHEQRPVSSHGLLTVTEERRLFLQMNCLRFLAARRQRRAVQRGIQPVDVRTVRNLLAAATDVRNRIALSNQGLVRSIAGKFDSGPLEIDDLVSEATIALMRAIDTFDVSRGFRLSTYATHAMYRHLVRILRRERRIAAQVPDERVEPAIDNVDPEWLDLHPSELVSRLMGEIPQRERRMVQLRFGLAGEDSGMTYQEIAAEFGVSSEWVRQSVIRYCLKARGKHIRRLGF